MWLLVVIGAVLMGVVSGGYWCGYCWLLVVIGGGYWCLWVWLVVVIGGY